jgi:ribonucleoside-diphosphate reductase alpha chain
METTVVPEEVVEATKSPKVSLGLQRHFTKKEIHPFEGITWVRKDAVLIGADGVEKFRQDDVEVPDFWSDTTINIVAEKYFRVIDGVKETSAKQMFQRVAGWITTEGLKQGLFSGDESDIFYDELLYILVHGMYAFNSPVWFNAGAVPNPQCSACFIQSVDDSMGSIMDLAKREVMLFKGGSGTGGNLSPVRSSWEQLSRGGWASGPVSFMKGFDSFAGVTKSGGTTRRAAKMQVLNVDHPDILEQRNGQPGFIPCKAVAEQLAHDLYETGRYSAEWNRPGNVYDLVGYQNANNSVRVSDSFMRAVEDRSNWATRFQNGEVHKVYRAEEIWDKIAEAAWFCGDPGLQFDTTTNDWHTCPESGRINASNPCSEYLFLDETACNLGSLNLLKFVRGKSFLIDSFKQAVDIAIIAKDIIVDAASYPSEVLAENSHKFRTLGLGYTNLGALLTYWGLGYGTKEGRDVAASITALMGGEAYAQSARLAAVAGPFEEFLPNSSSMSRVINKHLSYAVLDGLSDDSEARRIMAEASDKWMLAYTLGQRHGYRNAQVTVLAPTGTISFLMGCDTTGVEPMLGVVTFKKIVGEGLLTLPNKVVQPALHNLGYSPEEIESILEHISNTGTIHTAEDFDEEHSYIFAEALGDRALPPEAHIDMMAAVQPFLSGGISKTVNVPSSATKDEIADLYMRSWRKGLKCVAVFRDGCKLSQPVGTKLEHKEKNEQTKWGDRRKLPDTRIAKTHKFTVGGVKGYLTAGEYPDGGLGELFIRVSKQGSFLGGVIESFATAISIALQYGASLSDLVDKFKDVRFEPSGFTGNEDIAIAKSIVDYIFRWIENNYLLPPPPEGEERKNELAPVIPFIDATISFDGPPCTSCGNLTKRSGSCYICGTCGDTTGCG